jgi:predicted nucleotidyltransferase
MAMPLHPDFKDFLKLLNSQGVKYLLIGGYAVGYHGYPRATGDMDIWIELNEDNAEKTAAVLREFGMPENEVTKDIFLEKGKIIRMGVPPVRIEVMTGISGVDFNDCYNRRETVMMDDLKVPIISLEDLKRNKKASGRHKDLEDIEHLPAIGD